MAGMPVKDRLGRTVKFYFFFKKIVKILGLGPAPRYMYTPIEALNLDLRRTSDNQLATRWNARDQRAEERRVTLVWIQLQLPEGCDSIVLAIRVARLQSLGAE
eukprot:SAG31_NODE_766_length_12239_cov_16.248435_5_plen_103_part_00